MSDPQRASGWDIARVCALGAATAAVLPVLLFRRAEVAAELVLRGAVVGETAALGVLAVVAAALVPRLGSRLRSTTMVVIGGGLVGAGMLVLSMADAIGLFWVGGVLLAFGAAPGLVLHRIVLTEHPTAVGRFRTMALYWAAVATGVTAMFVPLVFDPVAYTTLLTWAAVATLVVAILSIPLRRLPDSSSVAGSRLVDVPWARRGYAAAFSAGAVAIGAADAAQEIVVVDWQRSPAVTAAVLAGGPAAAALISWFGPWYHRLARLDEGRRSDAAGTTLVVAGAMVIAGAASITYIGLVFTWLVAGGAYALAASMLDSATFASATASARRRIAARQVVALALGAATTIVLIGGPLAGLDAQWKLALAGVPTVVAGWRTRRGAPSARDAPPVSLVPSSNSLPRRVLGLEPEEPVPLLAVAGVGVAYGPVQVVYDVDLEVREGQIVALLGTNGAGKTTLMRAISGLEPVCSGRIVYAGLDVTRTRPTWRVGMGLQQIVGGQAVVPSLTVDENIRLFGHSVPETQAEEGTAEALELFPRLGERHDQPAGLLSGGEKQMLALAKALIVRPRLLLIDEFSLGLAPMVIGALLPVVRRIADGGASVLLVEQSANIALSVADHAYVMEKGEIRFSGDARELRDEPELLRSAYLEGLAQALEG